jgi:phage terminase large subunit GpA-like protein
LPTDSFNCEAVEQVIWDALRPDPDHTVTSWAEENVILPSAAAAEPGPYRVSRTPFIREIQDCLSPSHPANKVVFQKGVQISGTQAALNAIGFYIHHSPSPIMFVQKTTQVVERFSKQRVATMIAESPALREKIAPARSRDSGNTVVQKDFPGGTLIMTGANSPVGLRSMPARLLVLDEADSYEASAGDEGDPVKLAERRTTTFAHRRKIFINSTPTVKGRSRIENEYEASDQRMYYVPCPHCGAMQTLRFESLKWEWGRPDTVHYVCEVNGCIVEESAKEGMLAAGEWIAKFPERGVVGFHLNSLYSPPGWMAWQEIASEYEEATADFKIGKPEKLMTFTNTIKAETWEERGDAPDWHRLYDRRETWPVGVVPADGLVLTSFTDVQGDRLETSVWAWGEGMESWLIEHSVIRGAPNEAETWSQLHDLLNTRTWRHEGGHLMRIATGMVDSGAYTSEVYKFIRGQEARRIHAAKGQKHGKNVSWIGGDIDDNNKKHGGRKIRNIATSSLKHEFYRQLRLERPTVESGDPFPAGYVHLSDAVSEDGCRQLVSEVFDGAKGEWNVKQGERNEWLDCRIGARAAAYWAGVDMMSEDDWQSLREEYAGPTPEQVKAEPEKHRRESPPQRKEWLGPRRKNWLR